MNPFDNKILQHCDRIGAWQNGEFYPPIQVELDLTNRCSSACPWCSGYLHREDSSAELPGDLVRTLLSELSSIGVKSVVFTGGGDPTMHREWLQLVQCAHYCRLDVGIITNGVVDVRPVLDAIQWVRFSVDAATEELYARQHGKRHHFARVLENVKLAAEAQRKSTVGVAFVTSRDSRHEILPFVDLWRDIPVDYIQFRPLLDSHGTQWFDEDDRTQAILREAESKDSRVVCSMQKYSQLETSGMTNKCYGAMFETAVSADGLVYVCCHHKGHPEWALGDLRQEGFRTIWARHIGNRSVTTTRECPAFCRHFGTNRLFELQIAKPVTHRNFI